MNSLNKKKRSKYVNRYELVDSFVHCDNCNSDIPVRGNRDQGYVLRSHFSLCSKKVTSSSSESRKQNNQTDIINEENESNDVNDESGHEMPGETHYDNPGTVIDPLRPDRQYLKYQQDLSQAYLRQLIKMNRKGDMTASVQNNIDIASFVVDNNLTTKQFEGLMKLLNNIVSRECETHSTV